MRSMPACRASRRTRPCCTIGRAVFGNVESKTFPARELLEADVGPRRLNAPTED
jgi:hypothetical protein